MDRVALRAQQAVLHLQVEAAVEVERVAIVIELGTDPVSVGHDEIDLFRPG